MRGGGLGVIAAVLEEGRKDLAGPNYEASVKALMRTNCLPILLTLAAYDWRYVNILCDLENDYMKGEKYYPSTEANGNPPPQVFSNRTCAPLISTIVSTLQPSSLPRFFT